MSLSNKAQRFTVKEFSFGQLVPSEEVKAFEDFDSYELKSLDAAKDFKNNISQELIREERKHAQTTGFEVLPTVKEHRGLKEQEIQDYEDRVAEEVERRFSQIKEQAYLEGFEKGKEEGAKIAYDESIAQYETEFEKMSSCLTELKSSCEKIYEDSREEAYQMVKNLTKWVILKEVDEKYYLVRLLEKLIHEINTKSNLVVRVNEGTFGYMPEVIKIVERKMGVLTNVRVEVDLDQNENGIILESENTIIDGSLEAQFKSIDRLFETVGLNE